MTAPDPKEGRHHEVVAAPKPAPSLDVPDAEPHEGDAASTEAELEHRIAVMVESRVLSIIRRETGDPYAGLPADDVLARLDTRFPDVKFPERMMSRLEAEQAHRHAQEVAATKQASYELETRRRNDDRTIAEQGRAGQRAERVLYVLVAASLLLVFTGYEAIGGTVLGTTLLGVVASFVGQRFRR